MENGLPEPHCQRNRNRKQYQENQQQIFPNGHCGPLLTGSVDSRCNFRLHVARQSPAPGLMRRMAKAAKSTRNGWPVLHAPSKRPHLGPVAPERAPPMDLLGSTRGLNR
jgi:hypothetical protein